MTGQFLKRKKEKFVSFAFIFCAFFACPKTGSAAFVPAQDQIIETLSGKWEFTLSPAQIPTLQFTAPEGDLSFFPQETPMEWENVNKVIYLPRVQANLAFNRAGLECAAAPLKLWFESGDSFELGKNSCSETRLYATSRTGDRVEDRARENHLAHLLATHNVVAVSQGRKALILEAKEESAIAKYQMETSPEPNSAFTKRMRKKWAEALKKES